MYFWNGSAGQIDNNGAATPKYPCAAEEVHRACYTKLSGATGPLAVYGDGQQKFPWNFKPCILHQNSLKMV